jgi:predicted transcriptional regulator
MRKDLMDRRISKDEERLTRDALADVDAGRVVDHEAVLAWAQSLGADCQVPAPCPMKG